MKIAVCDTDVQGREQLQKILTGSFRSADISTFQNIQALLESFEKTYFDLVFVDPQQVQPEQYERADMLMYRLGRPLIIFVTDALDWAVSGYGIAFRFVKKPVTQENLYPIISDIKSMLAFQKVILNADGHRFLISIQDILYINVEDHRLKIHLPDGTCMVRGCLRNIERDLPPEWFSRPHLSYLVNLNEVSSFSKILVKISNGDQIPVSRQYYRAFSNAAEKFAKLSKYRGKYNFLRETHEMELRIWERECADLMKGCDWNGGMDT